MQQKKYWNTSHKVTKVLACSQWSVTFHFFLGAWPSSHRSQWAFQHQLQWELAQASVIFPLDWQGMKMLETQHVERLMGGNNTASALWLIKKWALNVKILPGCCQDSDHGAPQKEGVVHAWEKGTLSIWERKWFRGDNWLRATNISKPSSISSFLISKKFTNR